MEKLMAGPVHEMEPHQEVSMYVCVNCGQSVSRRYVYEYYGFDRNLTIEENAARLLREVAGDCPGTGE